MKTIYCISGLGADERAFSKLNVPGYKLEVIKWLLPEKDEDLPHYARRMRDFIKEENPVLMGLSFGGMVCTEIAKQMEVKKIIIISSIKTAGELPFWLKTIAVLRLNRIFPLRSTKLTQPIQNRMLGIQAEEEKTLVSSLRKKADLPYVTWAVDKAINWKNEWQHPKIFHIHGDNDRLFPIKYVKPTFTIKKAGHFMIMNRADEVSDCIISILQENE
ncbi:MAG: alpha/beta hydrolase [Ferruginibacter sp.]